MTMPTRRDITLINPGTPGALNAGGEEPAALSLDRNGVIYDCNKSAEELFGFRHGDLIAHHISLLLPQLSQTEWLQDGSPNPHLTFLCRIGQLFYAIAHDGSQFNSRLFLIDLNNEERPQLRLIIRRVGSHAHALLAT